MIEVPCAIALGSNLGDRQQTLEAAIAQLQARPDITILKVSPWYQTKPVGPPQPDYLNGCATLATQLSPWQLLDVLQAIEQHFGRERQVRWGARTLDLDLLIYGHWHLETARLQVPHPRMAERGFVLVPLVDIAEDWRVGNCSIAHLQSALDCSGVVPLRE